MRIQWMVAQVQTINNGKKRTEDNADNGLSWYGSDAYCDPTNSVLSCI